MDLSLSSYNARLGKRKEGEVLRVYTGALGWQKNGEVGEWRYGRRGVEVSLP